MTIPDQRQSPPAPPVPVTVVQPEKDSRLEQLLAQYDPAKAAAKAADDRLKAVTDGIKAELCARAPGEMKIDVHSEYLEKGALALRAQFQNRLNTTKLKSELPEIYDQFVTQTSFWKLEARR